MARTTVTPPVMASGAKASNTMPVKATAPTPAAPPAPRLAATPVKPKSPPPGAKARLDVPPGRRRLVLLAKMPAGCPLATSRPRTGPRTARCDDDEVRGTTATTTTTRGPAVAATKPGCRVQGVQAGSATTVATSLVRARRLDGEPERPRSPRSADDVGAEPRRRVHGAARAIRLQTA
jgi:hypothetical protein